MTRPIRIMLVLTWAAILGLVAMIVYASTQRGLAASLTEIASDPWGATTLADLYAGLAVVALWIAHCERRARRVVPWIVGLALLGNLTTLVYLAVRLRRARTLGDVFRPTYPGPNA